MTIKGVVINDLHFGIKDSKRLYHELHQFTDFINSRDDLNLLIIDGDYFDCKLSLGDPASYYATTFFKELVDIVKKKKLIFRILQGTRSHDLNQLQIFKVYENDLDMNFKIIETVQTENLCGLEVIYIPEEYPENADEYYKEYKSGHYDIMFAHTTFDFVAQPGQIEQSKKEIHSAPVLIWKEWKDALANGFASVGHIHGRNVYGKKIYYSGSFTRWNYGERSAKGFTYFEYDLDNKEYKVEFIDNVEAPQYNVFSISDLGIDLDNCDIQLIQEAINSQINDHDNFRIDISGISKDKIEILKESYGKIPNIKIEVREDKKVFLKENTEVKENFEKWHYITKRKLPLNETIKKYCKEELKVDIPLETINKILKDDE